MPATTSQSPRPARRFTDDAGSFGGISRALHWLTALMIVSAVALGLIGKGLPHGGSADVAVIVRVYSLHKTIGVAIFVLALIRIVWRLAQPRPAHLHPDRVLETWLADTVHWMLWLSLLLVPLSGWLDHAATTGFAPIWWPFGQSLPFVPKDPALAERFATLHFVAGRALFAAIALHVAGALKHHFVDRDATLMRMLAGHSATAPDQHRASTAPIAAIGIWAALMAGGLALGGASPEPDASPVSQDAAQAALPVAGGAPATDPAVASGTAGALTLPQKGPLASADTWQVTGGTLTIATTQMGAALQGTFAKWTAAITYDETVTDAVAGHAAVRIDMASLTLGSVTMQALDGGFFDVASFPESVFDADIVADNPVRGGPPEAHGSLTIRGRTVAVAFPLAITVTGDTAEVRGSLTLDRRDFGIGDAYPDEATVGFAVAVSFVVTAVRQLP